MPKIIINEVNLTTSQAAATTSGNIIAILGSATKGPVGEPTEINTYSQFINTFGSSVPSEDEYPYGYQAARACAFAGNPILFTRLANNALNASANTAVKGVYANGTVSNGYPFTFKAEDVGTFANDVEVNYEVNVTDTSTGAGTVAVTVSRNDVEIGSGTFAYAIDTNSSAYKSDGIIGNVSGVNVIQNVDVQGTTINVILPCTHTVTEEVDVFTAIDSANVSLSGGTNGVTSENDIYSAVLAACQKLQDDNIYIYQFIVTPGISHIESAGIKVWQIVSDLCCGTNFTSTDFIQNDAKLGIIDAAPTVNNYTEVLTDLGISEYTQGRANAQLAIMYPWYRGTLNYDNKSIVDIPPSIAYLMDLCSIQQNGFPCDPIAGPSRGVVSNVSSIGEYIGSTKSSAAVDSGLNVIAYHRNYGYFFEGNVVFNPSATSKTYKQLSIRNTINYIKLRLNEICLSYSYALNIPVIRTQVQADFVSLLDTMKTSSYIYGYSVEVVDSVEDMAQGRISIIVKIFPTTALEEFVIDLQIVNSEEFL